MWAISTARLELEQREGGGAGKEGEEVVEVERLFGGS